MKKVILFTFIFSLLGFSEAFSFSLEQNKDLYNAGLKLSHLKDDKKTLNIDDVSSKKWSKKFQKSTSNVPRFGFTKATIWLKIKVINNSPQKKWLFNISLPTIDKITLFKKEKEKWVKAFAGDTLSYKDWQERFSDFIFFLSKEREATYYFKLENRGATNFPLKIMSLDYFNDHKKNYNLFYGGYFGSLFVMFFYNLCLAFMMRSRSSWFFTGYLFSWIFLTLTITGFGRSILTDWIPFSNEGLSFSAALTFVFFILFFYYFLNIKNQNSFLKKIYHYTLSLCLIFVPFTLFLGIRESLIGIAFLGGWLALLALSTIFFLFKKVRTAKVGALSFLLFFIGALLKIFAAFGFIPVTIFSEQGILVGSIFQLIFLSLGLADRINQLQIREVEVSNEKRRIQNMFSDELKKEVDLKTRKIKNLLENLKEGFMVMGKEGVIQEGATKITRDLFKLEPEGKKFSDVLRLDEDNRDSFKKWIANIWKGTLSFKDLKDLGPKSYKNEEGQYIELDYRPIYEKNSKRKIESVICIARNKTNEIILEDEVEKDKEQAKFIKRCLESPVEFIDLIDDTYEILSIYNKFQGDENEELFRSYHTLKARYGQFGLKTITVIINDLETAISRFDNKLFDVKLDQFKLELQDFLKSNQLIVKAANKFMVDDGKVLEVSKILEKVKLLKTKFTKNEGLNELYMDIYKNYYISDLKLKFERFQTLVEEIAQHQGKSIRMEITGDEVKVDNSPYSDFINSTIHIFRNIIDHGIESEDERLEKNKLKEGHIKIRFKNQGNSINIFITDDGRGIDPEEIKRVAIKKGLASEAYFKWIKGPEILELIFSPGFSTKKEVSQISGRGVGMDAVKKEVENLRGKIEVASKVGQGTILSIELPIIR